MLILILFSFIRHDLLPRAYRNSEEIELESSNQEAFPSAGKNTRVVLRPCCTWKCPSTAISFGVDIPEAPEFHLLRQMFSVRVRKSTSRIAFSWYHRISFQFLFLICLNEMGILLKVPKPQSFETHNFL